MRISRPKNTAPHPEDVLVMLSVCDGDVFSNVRQLVLIDGGHPTDRSCEARKKHFCPQAHQQSYGASMGQNRLAGLTMTAVHSSHAQQVDNQTMHPAELQANPRKLFCQLVMLDYLEFHLAFRRTCHPAYLLCF